MNDPHVIAISMPLSKTYKVKYMKQIGIKVDRCKSIAAIVLERLNVRTGHKYKASSKTSLELIRGAIERGYTCEDLIKIVEFKYRQWGHVNAMKNYLKPTTLFAKYNIKKYCQEARLYYNPLLNVQQ